MAHSSSGQGHWFFTPITGVRFSHGLPHENGNVSASSTFSREHGRLRGKGNKL